ADRHTRDFTLSQLREALAEVIACFPVYRTYVRAGSVTPMDRRYVDWAVARAKKKAPDLDPSIFDFIRGVLLLDACAGKSEAQAQAIVSFAMKFPQVTSPATAKSLEDTAFYRYCRLTSLNEVGGDPRRFSVSVNAFHLENQERARRWPHAMLATSTHDNKRSEDVRARINVLSELAEEWREHVRRWARVNRNKRSRFEDAPAPSRNDEYLLYQTLVGAWPLEELGREEQAQFCERIEQYMIKAAREAKSETSWVNVNEAYEKSLTSFVHALLDRGDKNLFLADFLPFQKRIARLGLFNSLSHTLLKLTAPGVPDFYQGNEIWDFSLVDPDNRRPVDYARRQAMLDALDREMQGPALAAKARVLLDTLEDGRVKLYLTSRTLKVRGELARLFRRGEYLPLQASGPRAEHLIAFARRRANDIVIAVAPRLFARLCPEPDSLPLGEAAWGDTAIEIPFHSPDVRYTNTLTGEVLDSSQSEGKAMLRAASIFSSFPAALLVREA
ncbi:MAG TPA: malto-oligosyltrehalose synthase, partial [Burkholderiales bacterium]|nr:malto-oligosyltrehalose synthase [Burkholderiales bacterium]